MNSSVGSWTDVIDKFYLSEFIAAGGSAFKLLLTESDEETAQALEALRTCAEQDGYFHAQASAAETRIDRIENVFFAVAREVDWARLMAEDAVEFLGRLGYGVPEGRDISDVEAIAEHHARTVADLNQEIHRRTAHEIAEDRGMCKEFRTALAQLRRAQFFPRNVTPTDQEVVVGWLRGEKVSLGALRGLGLYSRVDRHNARDMLSALAHWLAKGNGKGLLIALDLSALLSIRPRRRRPVSDACDPTVVPTDRLEPGIGEPAPLQYTRDGFLDACELLRQTIDGTDEIGHCLVCCVAPIEFETGEKRSFLTYNALKSRLINEVHDRNRPNLLAAVVHATGPAEASEADANGR